MVFNAISLFSLLPLATAHFLLDWPTARGFDDAKAGDFACGGFNDVSSSRTAWPMTGAPIQLDMHHDQTKVAVYMSLGENPGTNFSIVLRQQFAMQGLGNFCLGDMSVPSGLNISNGTAATIQVVSNGDPDGGLYQCADVILVTDTLSSSDYSSHCNNRTGTKVTQTNISGNPNGTTDASPSATSGAAASGTVASASSTGLGAHPTAATWFMGAAGLAGLVML